MFCASSCRTAFHTAARHWAERAVASGILTIAELRSGDPAACTLLPRGIPPTAVPQEAGDIDDALGELVGTVLDALSADELAELPEPVWALVELAFRLVHRPESVISARSAT